MRGPYRLTRRGVVVVAIALVALAMGRWFGGRSLNAVVVPAVALLAVSWVGVWRVDAPTVERDSPGAGFPGATGTVELTLAGPRPVAVTVEDAVADGLGGSARFETIADGRTLTYTVTARERGVYELGPVTVTATDVFGLWRTVLTVDETDEVVVYPRVHPLYEGAGIATGYVGITDERSEFDTIREYRRGDALRDVNWKASAKRPGDLVVTEYAGEGAERSVWLGVGAGPNPDAAAEAAASFAAHLLDAGIGVGLVTPEGEVGPGTGPDQRGRLLTALARYRGSGRSPDMADVDIEIRPEPDGARVVGGSESRTFAEVAASSQGAAV
jgi:uncharacterized protein (DUF58 family)